MPLPSFYGDMPCLVNFFVDTVHSYSPNSRQVQPNEGEELAKLNKAAWVETSAKTNVNVGAYAFTLFRFLHLQTISRQSL